MRGLKVLGANWSTPGQARSADQQRHHHDLHGNVLRGHDLQRRTALARAYAGSMPTLTTRAIGIAPHARSRTFRVHGARLSDFDEFLDPLVGTGIIDWSCHRELLDGAVDLLFNLKDDIGERQDLGFQQPAILAGLKARLKAWEEEMDRSPTTFLVR